MGKPQELTDAHGEIVWGAQYKARGVAKEAISAAARAAGDVIRSDFRGGIEITRRGCITTGTGTLIHRSEGLLRRIRLGLRVG
ncbi:RHS domain-containing protein [Achromobacter spanius]|uniref:RHS domain-containing protein n=1 Tax=Achromobacter spanius TaxID=217203 RepID=UPI003D343C6F